MCLIDTIGPPFRYCLVDTLSTGGLIPEPLWNSESEQGRPLKTYSTNHRSSEYESWWIFGREHFNFVHLPKIHFSTEKQPDQNKLVQKSSLGI